MKDCSYCGRDNEDVRQYCRECGTALFVPEMQAMAEPVFRTKGKMLPKIRRAAAVLLGWIIGGTLVSGFGLYSIWDLSLLAIPIAPVACVFYGSRRSWRVEVIGWVLLLFLTCGALAC
jgi:hypothetical protein